MPRLIKLIDVNRFKKILKSFQPKQTNDETILKQYYILYMYSIFRLIVIALMITYFIGTMFLYVSNETAHFVSNPEYLELNKETDEILSNEHYRKI